MKSENNKQLLVPMILMILLFLPVIFGDIAPEKINDFINNLPEAIGFLYSILLIISMFIWNIIFYHIPIGIYIVILLIYTAVSWFWLLKNREATTRYLLLWFALCALSIIMYWRLGPIYNSMIND